MEEIHDSDYVVVLVTAASQEQAKKIARALLEKKLIACANLVPVRSLFLWEGAVQEENEVLLIIKSTSAVFKDQLIAAVKAEHSYQVPEVIGIPVVLGSDDYLKWISDCVTG